jgi:hypothetical protein
MGNDYQCAPEAVSGEWFLANVKRKFHGFESCTHPLHLAPTMALLFPELKFKLYEVHGGGKDVEGTWAVAHSVLIQERELPPPHCQKFCIYWVELSLKTSHPHDLK